MSTKQTVRMMERCASAHAEAGGMVDEVLCLLQERKVSSDASIVVLSLALGGLLGLLAKDGELEPFVDSVRKLIFDEAQDSYASPERRELYEGDLDDLL